MAIKKMLVPDADGVVRLSGGNPQIAKGDGNAVVQAYIDAMPGWKRAVGQELDALITRIVPDVCKCVKWNTPFYGQDTRHWFVSFHCFDRYIKVAFPQGDSLQPIPPVESKQAHVRYWHSEEGAFDAEQCADWIKQASALQGQKF